VSAWGETYRRIGVGGDVSACRRLGRIGVSCLLNS
jgi:hypothetical protein